MFSGSTCSRTRAPAAMERQEAMHLVVEVMRVAAGDVGERIAAVEPAVGVGQDEVRLLDAVDVERQRRGVRAAAGAVRDAVADDDGVGRRRQRELDEPALAAERHRPAAGGLAGQLVVDEAGPDDGAVGGRVLGLQLDVGKGRAGSARRQGGLEAGPHLRCDRVDVEVVLAPGGPGAEPEAPYQPRFTPADRQDHEPALPDPRARRPGVEGAGRPDGGRQPDPRFQGVHRLAQAGNERVDHVQDAPLSVQVDPQPGIVDRQAGMTLAKEDAAARGQVADGRWPVLQVLRLEAERVAVLQDERHADVGRIAGGGRALERGPEGTGGLFARVVVGAAFRGGEAGGQQQRQRRHQHALGSLGEGQVHEELLSER